MTIYQRKCLSLTSSIVALALSTAAAAQTVAASTSTDASDGGVQKTQEIIVTAQKRAQRPNDVPITLNVATQHTLQQRAHVAPTLFVVAATYSTSSSLILNSAATLSIACCVLNVAIAHRLLAHGFAGGSRGAVAATVGHSSEAPRA